MKNDNREWVTSGGLRGGAVAQSGGPAGACAWAQWLRAADERGLARGRSRLKVINFFIIRVIFFRYDFVFFMQL